jgi:hypothetical protein
MHIVFLLSNVFLQPISVSHGQFNNEFGSPGLVVLDADGACVVRDDGMDNGQAQAHSRFLG